MRNIEIIGYGYYVPETTVEFDGQIRHRVRNEETNQIAMAVLAAKAALQKAGVEMDEIDLIVSASAVGYQPIPCTAALIHEQLAKGLDIPAMDINTTCTSFISAFDMVSYLIDAGRYQRVLIISSEYGSQGLNPDQKESYELFGDGAAAVVVARSEDGRSGILAAVQRTWSEGAHDTEIRGGLGRIMPVAFTEERHGDFQFDMKGLRVLKLAASKLPKLLQEFLSEHQMTMDDIDVVVPHQASRALGPIMKKVGIPEDKYINIVEEYGNMISAAIPHAFMKAVESGRIQKGDTVMLIGTAAGLTANILVFKY